MATYREPAWKILWDYWHNLITEDWGPGKVGGLCGPDIGNLKVFLDQCDYNVTKVQRMMAIASRDWDILKAKHWEIRQDDFPTLTGMKRIREHLFAAAGDGEKV